MKRKLFFVMCMALSPYLFVSCDKEDDYDEEILEGIDEQGAIVGEFSIGANRKCHFSRGNLQYQASTNTWRFAEHQYDIVGRNNEKRSSTYNGWIDMFVRATSGYDPLLPPYASMNFYDEDSVFNETMNSSWYFVLKDISGTPYDWGTNPILNGGNTPDQWRTLKSVEWEYLLVKRTNASNLLGYASVNNRYGLIILPDNWVLPDGLNFKNIDMIYDSNDGYYMLDKNRRNNITEETIIYKDNKYTKSEWAKMQQNGAVFLPVIGYMSESYDGAYSDDYYMPSYYWASSYTVSEVKPHQYFMSFDALSLVPKNGSESLCSVRLIRDVK